MNIYFYYKKMRIFSSTIILIIISVGTNWFPLKNSKKKIQTGLCDTSLAIYFLGESVLQIYKIVFYAKMEHKYW